MPDSPAQPAAASSEDRPQLGVVMPLANEEGTVTELLSRVTAQLEDGDLVICIIDTVTTDATFATVEAFAEADPRVVAVWAEQNRCVVDAYVRGYREALEADCTWILEMDGGMSHRPEEIPRFLEAMSTGVDFAAGSRFLQRGSYKGFSTRYLLSRGGTILANAMLGTKMKDMTSGFECFTREALQYVLDRGIESRAHFFQTEIRAMLHSWKWVEVPITYRNPSKRVGSASVREALRNLWRLRQRTRTSPAPVPEETAA